MTLFENSIWKMSGKIQSRIVLCFLAGAGDTKSKAPKPELGKSAISDCRKKLQTCGIWQLKLRTCCRVPEVASRTPGSRPRPRTQQKSEAKDSPSEDRPSRGPRPRTKDTSASVLKKKRSSKKFFRRSPKKKGLQKFFPGDLQRKTSFEKFFRRSTKFKRFKT